MAGRRLVWTLAVTSVAVFMVALDNLVVTNALPSIRRDLGTGLAGLEWTVNAYTLTFAVFLLPAAAVGDRLGRRHVFVAGLAVFTIASAAAAVAPNIGTLIAARAVQGSGAAAVLPLSMTLLSAAVPTERRGAILGVWGAASGVAVALGPLVGGAITEGLSWQWIFWLNVPIGVVLVPCARARLSDSSRGPAAAFDLPGVVLVAGGLFGVVLGLVHAGEWGWSSPSVLVAIGLGAGVLLGFLAWERHTPTPVLPMRLMATRTFAVANIIAMMMSFGMFGSVFLLAQFLQTAQGLSPLQAGIRTLPWTAMPVLIAPVAGRLTDRIGGRPLLIAGLTLQATALGWIALISSADVAYTALVVPFLLGGVGMSLFFVPLATVVLGGVSAQLHAVASGTNNAVREVGGVLGTAVLAAVFSTAGGFATPQSFSAGLRPAVFAGAVVVAIGAAVAITLPRQLCGAAATARPARKHGAATRLSRRFTGLPGTRHRIAVTCRVAASVALARPARLAVGGGENGVVGPVGVDDGDLVGRDERRQQGIAGPEETEVVDEPEAGGPGLDGTGGAVAAQGDTHQRAPIRVARPDGVSVHLDAVGANEAGGGQTSVRLPTPAGDRRRR